jgi:hypothetical protein
MRAWIAGVLLALTVAPAVAAEPEEWETLDADAIIAACGTGTWQIRSIGSIDAIYSGNVQMVICLEEAVKTQAAAFQLKPAEEFANDMADLRRYIFSLYQDIHTDNPGCRRFSCGVYEEMLQLFPMGEIYREMIRNMVAARKEGQF